MKIKYIHFIIIILLLLILLSFFTFTIESTIESLVTSDELQVYDENKPLYNIGDLTRMPFFFKKSILNRDEYYKDKQQYIIEYINNNKIYYDSYPNSIFSNYLKLLDEKTKVKESNIEIPNIELLQKATDIYYENNKGKIDEFFNTINNDKTLFVHIRSGDKGNIEDSFIKIVQTLENKYEKIVLLGGVHNSDLDNGKKNLINDFNKLLINEKYINNMNDPDTHLCFFRKCKNLLVHKGGFSELGCILFNGDNLYYIYNLMTERDGEFNEIWYSYINTKNITYL